MIRDSSTNLNKYYSLEEKNTENKCRECFYTFIKDAASIIIPPFVILGIIILFCFIIKNNTKIIDNY